MKNLVIVESPTKAKTISKFLGKDYLIKYSMGHVMDLPKNKLGINIEDSFSPEYEIIEDKKKIIAELKKEAKGADNIILATDPDREGEAIAYSIRELLGGKTAKADGKKFKRIVFHEITKQAVQHALDNPREVDEFLVKSQTARRVLDRLVGYQLSPVLWKKIRRGLSAGRVQSIALRFILEREEEIKKFEKQPYWSIHLLLSSSKSSSTDFELTEINGKRIESSEKYTLYDGEYTVSKTDIDTQEKADNILQDLAKAGYIVSDIVKREAKRSPAPPYTTSTLQQDASRRFGYSGKRTMSLAQKLYEEGFITYHRTDSVTISQTAIEQIRGFIKKEYGIKYMSESPRVYSAKQKLAQEAHEGIRPTDIAVSLQAVTDNIGLDYAKLYELIWIRATASQMSDALIESTTVYVDSKETNEAYKFKASGSVLVFDGFLKLNPHALKDNQLPQFTANENLKLVNSRFEKHESLPPPRYNDASLIGTLEERGIGRPSTYASIISILVDRAYVERVEKRFEPTPIGTAVNEFLVKNFSMIDDIPFTAKMEDNLDEIANGKQEWETMMKEFYDPFGKLIAQVEDASRVKIEAQETDEICPECQAPLVIRHGRFGKFFSCSRFPDCKFTKPFVEETNIICPKDGGKVIIKKTRKGRKFYGCQNYPACDFAAWKLEDIKKN